MFCEDSKVLRKEQENLFRLFNKLPVEIKMHSRCVADMAVQIFSWAKEVEFADEAVPYVSDSIHKAVLFHDIGFSAISIDFTGNDERTAEVEVLYRSHTICGGKILELHRVCSSVSRVERDAWLLATDVSVGHHERWDGKGYPYGVMTTAVPFLARIASIANEYDDLIRGNRYARAVPAKVALKKLEQGAGTKFDPKLIEIILRKFRVF